MKKTLSALVMCIADPSRNPRPNRIIKLLDGLGYEVDAVSHKPNEGVAVRKFFYLNYNATSSVGIAYNRVRSFTIYLVAFFLRFERFIVWANDFRLKILILRKYLKQEQYDLIVVENIELLPLAFHCKRKAKILFDAREYYTKEFESNRFFRLFISPFRKVLCNRFLHRCDRIITVSFGLAKAFAEDFGIRPLVIRSVPYFYDSSVTPTLENKIRMVHHGVAHEGRNIEKMIDVVKLLDDRFTLDFYLVGSPKYISEIRNYAKNTPAIRFCSPVAFGEIIPMLNQYDAGFYYLEPTGFNYLSCLPNKLFEFIQARLAVLIGPSIDMKDIVTSYKVGVVASEFSAESMAFTINKLQSKDFDHFKSNSDIAAKELCFENESKKLISLIGEMYAS